MPKTTPHILTDDEPETRDNVTLNTLGVGPTSPQAFNIVFGDIANYKTSGVSVNEETALGVPALWAAVDFISNTIATLPLILYKEDAKGVRTASNSDPLFTILHDKVNSQYLTSQRWRRYMMERLLLNGRAFSYIERNKAGRVTNIWPLDPVFVTIDYSAFGPTTYTYAETGKPTRVFEAANVIDLVWFSGPDITNHRNPIQMLRHAIGVCIDAEKYAATMFASNGIPPFFLQGAIGSGEAMKRASKEVKQSLKEANSDGSRYWFAPDNYKVEKIGVDPVQAQMMDNMKFGVIQIARMFGLPPVFLQDLSTGTYSNTEQQDLAFAKHCVIPHVKRWEQELNTKLFSDRNRNNFVEFNVDGLLRGDALSRVTAYAQAINSGQLTINEARALENRPPVPGGDKARIQGATVPLDQADAPAPDPALNPVADGGDGDTDPVSEPDGDDKPATP